MDRFERIYRWLQDNGDLVANAFIGFAIGLLLAACLVGCKATHPIAQTRDSVRVEVRLDSVYIFKHDSVFRDRWKAGDTVYVTTEKWRTLYKDKIAVQHDSIQVAQTETIEVRYIPPFYKRCTIALWVLVLLVALGIVARILIKIYLHR